jgi:hypothetical protein
VGQTYYTERERERERESAKLRANVEETDGGVRQGNRHAEFGGKVYWKIFTCKIEKKMDG